MSTVTEAKPEKFIVPAEEHPQVIALKQGYQAAFFPDGKIRENPYLNTGNVECAWAWLEGFHYGTHCVALQNEVTRLKLEVANLKTFLGDALPVAPMQPANGRILTCVYCGHEYPQNTPAAGSQVLTEHIRVCEKHPMRKAEADIALLRSALAGLIGTNAPDELRQMEATLHQIPAPEADKAVSINAIHALLKTHQA